MIIRVSFAVLSVAALAACDPAIPDSGTGVGFTNYTNYQAQREAELIAAGEGSSANVSVSLGGQAATDPSTDALIADAAAAIPSSVENAVGISSENDFDAVAGTRSIEEDAALVAANRQQYQQVEPTVVPSRPASSQPNLVEFALSTTNNVGQPIYSRLILGAEAREARNCAKYASSDLAQIDFLASGGPERNAKGLDADGDGFACSWDPSPFRLAAQARNN